MFVYLFGAVVEFALWVVGIYIVYRVIFSKSISEKKKAKEKKLVAEKLALLTLKSSNPQEVSNFVRTYVSDLSKETFDKLTEHLDFLNVLSEEPLKARFENLKPVLNEIVLNEPIPEPIEVLKNPPTLRG